MPNKDFSGALKQTFEESNSNLFSNTSQTKPAQKELRKATATQKDAPKSARKKITLSLDENQIKKIKIYAAENATSVSKIFGTFIDSLE